MGVATSPHRVADCRLLMGSESQRPACRPALMIGEKAKPPIWEYIIWKGKRPAIPAMWLIGRSLMGYLCEPRALIGLLGRTGILGKLILQPKHGGGR